MARESEMVEPIASVSSLSVSYGAADARVQAVRGVSFEIAPGEAFGLIGESGSGKTTVAFAMMRHLNGGRVDAGGISLLGEDVLTMAGERILDVRGRLVAMVYQDPQSSLNPIMRVGDQIVEVLRRHLHMRRAEAVAECRKLLGKVGLGDTGAMYDRYPHQLSGGQQQRVVIAMALACKPRLLIMDEPTTGLDVTTEAVILELIADLRRSEDLAILFISHNLGVVAKVCDRVGVMYAGELVETGDVDDVLLRPKHPYTDALLRALPKLEGERLQIEALRGNLPDLRQPPAGCVFTARCDQAELLCDGAKPVLREISDDRKIACHFDSLKSRDGRRAGLARAPLGDEVLIEARDLRKSFTVREGGGTGSRLVTALGGVSLQLRRGETLAVVGESGSGKSTLARCIVGLGVPDSGTLMFGAEKLPFASSRRSTDVRRRVQMVFQNPDAALNPLHTIEQIVARPVRLYGLRRGAGIGERVRELLAMVKLDERLLKALPHALSGGQKQRIAIARALAAEPDIIVCDEPTSALDISVQAALLNELMRIQSETGTSYLFISHDLGVVRNIADRVMVMKLGLTVEQGDVDDVFSRPAEPYTRQLIDSIPTLARR